MAEQDPSNASNNPPVLPRHPAAPRNEEPPAKRPRTGNDTLASAFEHVLSSSNYHRTGTGIQATGKEVVGMARAGSALLVHVRQRGNPVLKWIRQVTMDMADTIDADFVAGKRTGILYLSLRYHHLKPGYIYGRVREMGLFEVRVLLVLVDVSDWAEGMRELSKLAVLKGLVVLCAGSLLEAGRYLEMLRALDLKTADDIRERTEEDYSSRLQSVLSSVRAVNKTDATTLAFNFGPLKNIADASIADLQACPGIGERKVTRLHAALYQPFLKSSQWTAQDSEDG